MKYVFLVLLLALMSCSRDYSQFQNSQYAAMSASELPLYEGITEIMSGNSFKTLMPGTQVYITTDSATNNGVQYVKVLFGDSSGYTLANRLMPKGQWAVITASEGTYNVNIYSNAEFETILKGIDNDWVLVVAGEQSGNVTPVMYDIEDDEPLIGYVPSVLVYKDEGSVDYYKEYLDAQDMYQAGSTQPLKDLFNNPDYSGLRLAQWRSAIASDLFGEGDIDERGDAETGEDFDNVYAEGDAPEGDFYKDREAIAQESGWARNGTPVSENPGSIRKYFVFEDGTEMRAEGYELANSQPWRKDDNGITKNVSKVRFEVIPTANCRVSFDFESFYDAGSDYNTSWTRIFDHAEANKPVSVVVEDKPGLMIFCSVMRMHISVEDVTAIATVSGDCGD